MARLIKQLLKSCNCNFAIYRALTLVDYRNVTNDITRGEGVGVGKDMKRVNGVKSIVCDSETIAWHLDFSLQNSLECIYLLFVHFIHILVHFGVCQILSILTYQTCMSKVPDNLVSANS